MDLNLQIIEKNGKKEFEVLPYEEFIKIQEELDDYDELRILREAKKKENDAPTVSLKDVKKRLNLE